MKSRFVTWGMLLAGLLFAGVALRPLVVPSWRREVASHRALQVAERTRSAAPGLTLGIMGGFRGIMADFVWLRAHVMWERRDAPATVTLLNLATAIDPRSVFFWVNGARMMAYDMPVWRIAGAGGSANVPAEVQHQIETAQARLALAFIDRAMTWHPASATLWIERANIELNRLHNQAAAAESYRQASRQSDAPYFAARLCAQLLWRTGRKADAYDVLVRLHPTLPAHDERAASDLVLERIRRLERELGIVEAEAYQPASRNLP